MSIRLENGKTFTILAHNANKKNIYIQSAKLNGKEYDKNYFTHQDIIQGGTLEFQMGPNPNTNWGASAHTFHKSVYIMGGIPSIMAGSSFGDEAGERKGVTGIGEETSVSVSALGISGARVYYVTVISCTYFRICIR